MIDRRAVLAAGAVVGLAACRSEADAPTRSEDIQPLLAPFALNVESWFGELDFEQRFDAAARAGFSQVEFWFIDSWKRNAAALAKVARDAGVDVAQIVGDAPMLARDDVRGEFVENCKRAVENAATLNCQIVTITGHNDVEGISREDSLARYTDHMAAVAPMFAEAGVVAAIEPFNRYNHPGHFLYGSPDAVRVVEQIGSPAIKLNWDLFHMQREEGELIGNLRRAPDAVGYIQVADAPDRHEPGTGDVNYAPVLQQVRAGGYDGPLGLELWPKDGDNARAVQAVLALARAMK